MPEKKKSLKGYLDAVLGEDGVRTEVIVTLTNATMTKAAIGLIAAGASIALIANILKNVVRNNQLVAINAKLDQIIKSK